MVPIKYWIYRLLRRITPQAIVDWMMDRDIYGSSGGDTRTPGRSVERIIDICLKHAFSLEGKTVCVVGYGGGFAIGLHLLEQGVRNIILQDPFAPLRTTRHRRLPADRMSLYFEENNGQWVPKPDYVKVVREHLSQYARRHQESIHLVWSSSVLEHVSDVSDIVAACARLTRIGGLNIHNIDLRDHYFKYPFEMLCYSELTWKRWLNPSNNLNRWRAWQFEKVFGEYFSSVTINKTTPLPDEFKAVKHRIRSEFLSGDDLVDHTGKIIVEAVK
jgi:hypothetical protein